MGSNHFSSTGLLRDLPMEIHFAFYPQPTVVIPEIGIPELIKYEYKFDRERTAIRKYDEEQKRLRLQIGQQKNKQERIEDLEAEKHKLERAEDEAETAQNNELSLDEYRPIDPSKQKQREEEYLNLATVKIDQIDLEDKSSEQTTSKSQNQRQNREKKPIPFPSLHQNKFSHQFIVKSINSAASSNGITKNSDKIEASILPSTSNPWPSQPHFPPQNQRQQKYMLTGLEEFERKRDLFDLLELRSLDDRRELEKLLLNGDGTVNWDAGGNNTTGIG